MRRIVLRHRCSVTLSSVPHHSHTTTARCGDDETCSFYASDSDGSTDRHCFSQQQRERRRRSENSDQIQTQSNCQGLDTRCVRSDRVCGGRVCIARTRIRCDDTLHAANGCITGAICTTTCTDPACTCIEPYSGICERCIIRPVGCTCITRQSCTISCCQPTAACYGQ